MKPRTRTLGVIGATVVTAGLVLGIVFASSSAASATNETTASTLSMPIDQMPDMGSMMTGDANEMTDMMGSADMSAMHSMMHRMMEGTVDDDVLACDTAHAAMGSTMTGLPETGQMPHGAHHGGTGS